MTTKSFDVVGIGNAIVDVLVQADDRFLGDHGLTKGTMALIDEQQAEQLYASVGPGLETSGGSAANTLAGIAQLGGRAGFIGRVRDDQLGAIFSHDIRSVGAHFDTPAARSGPSTARCLILVTPDAQRTMCTYLGASVGLDPTDLDLTLVSQARLLYLEGYLWDSEEAKRAFLAAAEAIRATGGEVALSLSDAFCVERHRDSFLELVDGHVDLLFANEMEITALYRANSFEEAADQVRGRCKVAALTRSEQGSLILSGDTTIQVEPVVLGNLIDTTGAGDLYAAGFLYGYTRGESLERCGRLGSLCAGAVVTQLGPRPQGSLKDLVASHLG
ncbi:adenosine kinase [Synechococcus sp. CCY9201]|uniref:adenosine kinase n=1 Tax=unclassified Synechococcus TaxID=2626047 RepID=UPI0018CD61D1|nr:MULTISPECIES: adenosine kinase [unclassified Synechococcus]MEA5424068.1 adenosine kinase [Synechococcus sp. CCY9202]MEA5473383.1 adenosine kinase [Synechococcus sp. CCY9201]QPN60013.1 adenosine kinase [Synechococcus sp. CBW1002]QPN66819.1 adenosine kinase [Synechococcus sp. CBW1006]CAK6691900.1 putative sugar kinase YdjH [Synechococcus sp. CBW1107]